MKILKNTQCSSQQGAASQRRLQHKELVGENKAITSELNEAVENGDMDSFVNVLGKVLDQVTWTGDSLLHLAANLGKEKTVELICDHFPELLLRRNVKSNTVLDAAVRSKNSTIDQVHSLQLSHREDKEITKENNEYGDTPLHEAVYSGDVRVIKEILLVDNDVV